MVNQTNKDIESEKEDIFDFKNLVNQKQEQKEIVHEGNDKSLLFKLMFGLMLFLIISLLYRGIVLYQTDDYLFRSFLNNDAPEMPVWYPLATIILSIIALIGIILTYLFKKIGPFLVVGSLFISAAFQPEFMADGTLFTLFALFVFIGYGLAIIYPYWSKFK
jgi:hypothetical protein